MKKVLSILGIVILFGIGFMLLMPGRQTYEPVANNEVRPAVTTEKKQVAPVTKSETTTSGDSACITALKAQVKEAGTEYERGSILVSFPSGTTQEEANSILKVYDLSLDTAKPSNFSTLAWGTVTVPGGEEMKTVCDLKTDTKIRHVTLNTILNLHE